MRSELEVILDSLVQLTEQRQLESLAQSLISTVEQFIQPIDTKIFDIQISHSALEEIVLPDEFSSHVSNNIEQGDHDILIEQGSACFVKCISSLSACYSKDIIPAQIAIPITLNGCAVKVLWVKAGQLTELNINLLKGFAKVYENFLTIVIECETDELTGLLNRKAFERRLKLADSNVIQLVREKPETIERHWLCIFDIDKFKQINDTFGHLYGDEILLDLVKVMNCVFSRHDAMFRFGGDEFVLLLAPCTKQKMFEQCQAFQSQLSQFHGRKLNVTVSMGVTPVTSGEQASSLLVKADQALYHIKETGRNRVEVYEDLLSQGHLSENKFDDDIEIF
ncbi:GGDEF domain-containing protein [Shewanella eurypsychrophilus]|uniref:diguanylate cyclase n=1 Tax=Shewanella eurypsychrophilus TaxID=2593656 RepID=A0ABX6V5C2_9GAMM|nr:MULTISPECIES: GGDEF domain-containing protein [Shewanella]QFU21721.1 diguanylate cyclase [Shewanella sp. YLB-09]QPG57012.1 GGDEF domain-containing protein [Shewanella eurypsychrophilus]